ncbi:MAG TPA: hypothetical protein VF550_16845, partial [Polyangia bacterium]
VGKARLRQRDCNGNPGRVSFALGTCHPPSHPLAALGLAKPSAPTRHPPPRSLRSASRALAPGQQAVGKARLRQRDCNGNPGRVSFALGTCHPPSHPLAALGLAKPAPTRHPPPGSLRAASRALAPGQQAVGKARLRQRDVMGTLGGQPF